MSHTHGLVPTNSFGTYQPHAVLCLILKVLVPTNRMPHYVSYSKFSTYQTPPYYVTSCRGGAASRTPAGGQFIHRQRDADLTASMLSHAAMGGLRGTPLQSNSSLVYIPGGLSNYPMLAMRI